MRVPEPSPSTNQPVRGPRANPSRLAASIGEVVRAGLTATPKWLPPILFYDRVGSQLFERICESAEYYLTRTERGILTRHAAAIAAALPHRMTVVELGCGTAEKTEILLRALLHAGRAVRYLACDVSEEALAGCAARLRSRLPALDVVPVLGDFEFAFQQVPPLLRDAPVWAFLGSSIGNLAPAAAAAFLGRLRRTANGHLLLGADMVKDARVLHAAYDDAGGITAAFNRNVLHRINRELDADFAPERFAHRARYCEGPQRIEMHLVSMAEQRVRIRGLGLDLAFARGETIHTEDSHKYTAADLQRMAAAAGFAPLRDYTDDAGWFTVALWGPG